MEETKYYVDDVALKTYDPQMKAWFQRQIDAVPMMDITYYTDENGDRILEFIERTSVE